MLLKLYTEVTLYKYIYCTFTKDENVHVHVQFTLDADVHM